MSKQPIPIADKIRPTPPQSMLRRAICMLAVAIVLVPVAVDGTALIYAQWCEMMGKSTMVRTPVFDLIGNGLQYARDLLADSMGPMFGRALGDPELALPVAAALVVVGIALLRR